MQVVLLFGVHGCEIINLFDAGPVDGGVIVFPDAARGENLATN
jgi:hypothetical protein